MVILQLDATAQDTGAVKKLIRMDQDLRERFPAEKLYLHFDRPSYTTFDTIWFKAYLFNAATYSPSRLSSKVYIELINDSSSVVNRFAIPMGSGLGQGHIILNEKISDGTYTVRAYTNWMQNFGEDAYFSKQFYIGKPSAQGSWLVNEQHNIKAMPQGNEVNLALKLTSLTNAVIPYRDIELRLTEGKKTLVKNNYLTTDGGNINANFMLPKKTETRRLSLLITDKTTKNKYIFPFYPGGYLQNIDLQFMPEGGNLVNGISSRVAFKAISEDGLGTAVTGHIVNNSGQQVSSFSTSHNGMGSFILLPKATETYTAKFELNDASHSVPLPVVQPSGLSLRVDNLSSPDSVYIHIKATPGIAAANKSYSLIVQSAGGIYLGLSFKIGRGFNNIPLEKSYLMSGIVSFTIIDADNRPLCERRIFIDHHDRLDLEVANAQTVYTPQDSIALNIHACDANGHPIAGSFSVGITDDAFIKNDASADNIVSRLLLTSELKGHIENPGWYFNSNDLNTAKAMDDLMLTQGWTGFDWEKAMLPIARPQFIAEPGNRLTGRLRNLFNKPAKDSRLNLFSVSKKYGLIVLDTISDAKGEFAFENLPLFDTIAYTLRVNNKKDKASTADIILDLFKPTAIAESEIRIMPWYVHAYDSLMLAYFNRPQPIRYNGIDISEVKGKLLKEVKIKADKPHVNVAGYNGFVKKEIFEKELVEAGKMTLFDLLSRKIGGFGVNRFYAESVFSKPAYHIYDPALVIGTSMVADIIVDGMSTSVIVGVNTSIDPVGDPQTTIDFMKSIGADDVKDIKIAEGTRLFITVTTRSGNGIFTQPAFNIFSYRPVPFCLPKQFYRPRYDVKNTTALLPRPTLHWEPNIITDGTGKAALSFFAADKPGTYTVIIEGTDMNGNFGRQTSKITISPQAAAQKRTQIGK
ncbi:hypothetical protein [Mucilaginibacter gilvus]|uniref:Carboxypeptidase regulatory-like domain-containing protein n=1 Tax=Mucilaginibacter gilvus TaxID=2305909 RepID=A0A444MMP4_9SPHI|nr:hypothetical protein [Mucilaginibacter gilvus]RWY50985.1 hypothetical protein EPL05_13010 [Mucilaginibacter gilvus]